MSRAKSYWQGKTILLTGASSGLGRAVAEHLAPYGVHLGLCARRIEEMEKLALSLSHTPSRFTVLKCDVRDRAQVEAAVAAFAREAGHIDVAWVNSGVGGESSFEGWRWDHVETMIDTNLKGFIYTVRASLERMVPAARDGRVRGESIARSRPVVVGISSAAAMRGLPGASLYSATKVAVQYAMEGMACEHPEIQFTTILPGFVDTPINQDVPNRMFLLTPAQAARLMTEAVRKGKAEFVYPRPMAVIFHLVRWIPARVFRALAGRFAIRRPQAPQIARS
ncbi:MAG: SDR family NAD(P)-dependent oxidoreductase [Bdellovibrionales bacterium]|nr:SDR family NAD(P)-dependent oxidoreductase [Bdellovibrionales bacterium]